MRKHILLGLALLPLPVMAAPPQVVTDMPVTASLAQQVMGDLAEVQLLLDQGADPHDFQLRPSQARALENAGLLIWMGPELTMWLDDAATQLGADRQMQLLRQPGTHLRDYAEGGAHGEGHDHDHSHDHDHDHSGVDPHAWLDPDNGKLWLTQIAERLTQLDPENAATYAANADAAAQALTTLDAEIAATLAPAKAQPFVTFHDAYGYFTEHYGMPGAVTVAIGDATAPSASRLREVRDQIAQSGARCAFAETGHSSRMIDTAIEGMDLKRGEDLSPEGADIAAGAGLYSQLLSDLAGRISACASAAE